MGDIQISVALRLLSLSTQEKAREAFHAALRSPSPTLSSGDIEILKAAKITPHGQLAQMKMKDTFYGSVLEADLSFFDKIKPGIEYYDVVERYHDGTSSVLGIPYHNEPRVNVPQSKPQTRLNRKKLSTSFNAMLKEADKLGIPTTAADRSVNNAKIEMAMKAALIRLAAKEAMVRGGLTSAVLTMVFDIKSLWDGEFTRYLTNIGISGLYGGTVEGLSTWIDHPFFGNGLFLGFLVGSAFNFVSLAGTGDWARFGKDIGLNFAGAAASWGGASAGAWIGAAMGGPFFWITSPMFSIVGGISAGYFGRRVASKVPILGGKTGIEYKKIYSKVKQQLSSAGLEPDPSLSPKEVVDAIFKSGMKKGLSIQVKMTGTLATEIADLDHTLRTMQSLSPDAFDTFVALLRNSEEAQG